MVQIKNQLAPQSVVKSRTYGKGNKKKGLVVHQTGNIGEGANAQAHANLQSRGNPRSASWHLSVDDKEAIRSFEDDVMCWHATDGRGPGNTEYIAMELCINSDGDYKTTLENGAAVARQYMQKYNWTINDIKQHFNFYPKNCPAQIRASKDRISWNDFLKMVQEAEPAKTEKITPPKTGGVQVENKPSTSKPKPPTGDPFIREVQTWIVGYGYRISIDGISGPETRRALIRVLQSELNRQFKAGLVIDGIYGPKTRAALVNVRQGARGNITRVLQAFLYINGFNPGPFDGVFGNGTDRAVKDYQRAYRLTVDGIVGPATWGKLLG